MTNLNLNGRFSLRASQHGYICPILWSMSQQFWSTDTRAAYGQLRADEKVAIVHVNGNVVFVLW
jgi:uncharacterized protein with WD repeat